MGSGPIPSVPAGAHFRRWFCTEAYEVRQTEPCVHTSDRVTVPGKRTRDDDRRQSQNDKNLRNCASGALPDRAARGRAADGRVERRHSAAAGRTVPSRCRCVPAEDNERVRSEPAPGRARHAPRRGDLPEGEDSKGKQRQPARVYGSPRPAAELPLARPGRCTGPQHRNHLIVRVHPHRIQRRRVRRSTDNVDDLQDTGRDTGRTGDRRSDSVRADVRHRAGRGSVRSDDGGRSEGGKSRPDPGGIRDARNRDLGEPCICARTARAA